MEFWVARVIVHYQKSVPTGKVLPDFRNKALMEPIHTKCSCCPGLLVVVQPKNCSLCWPFPFEVLVLIWLHLSIPVCLKSWWAIHFPTNKCPLWHFFFPQNRALLYAFKTYSGRYPFSLMVFQKASGNLSAVCWSVETASALILTLF